MFQCGMMIRENKKGRQFGELRMFAVALSAWMPGGRCPNDVMMMVLVPSLLPPASPQFRSPVWRSIHDLHFYFF